ncbi:citrate synthase [Arsenicicoccus sp. oral taxon 190]|uniref:citrate synthase n=1 Tax=Arsenicicoccus sp. oral taxon 190 TaxID=1658671 RepID=UPI000679FC36|nr:citrate synthase [Arsenicicoccus sp. oral taxon 190]AKT50481.1 hypothetical protein ADJ73_02645 [Arsenicicoccus sp. oral taxon 190]
MPKKSVSQGDLLSTAQVARLLGVKTQTVYAYVSRGQLRAVRRPGERTSYFRLADVEALRDRVGAPGRGSGLAESIRTSITLLEHDRLRYRGVDASTLAATATVEEVAGLLWEAEAGGLFTVDVALADRVRDGLEVLPTGTRTVERLRLAMLLAGVDDPLRHDLDPGAVRRRCGRALASIAAALAPGPRAGAAYGAGDLATAWTGAVGGDPADPRLRDLVRRALVLLADHDMAGSTTAVRVSASVRADPCSCLLAGLAAMDSPLHGAAGVAARGLLEDLLRDPAGTLGRVLAQETDVPGFGHRIYREQDPRAEHLLGVLREQGLGELAGPTRLLEEALWERRGLFPNSDWALAVLTRRHGLAVDATETLFAAGRLVGWVAHLLEEYAAPPLRFRLAGVYHGPR